MCTWITQCMRCDRLTAVIFRASGSKFRVTVRASAREIPHTTASRHRAANQAKRAASAACPRVAIVESRNARYSLQNRPTQPPHRFHLAALSQTAPALICALTRSTTRTPHRSTLPSPPRHKSARRSSTTDQKPYALLDLHRLTQPPNHPSS